MIIEYRPISAAFLEVYEAGLNKDRLPDGEIERLKEVCKDALEALEASPAIGDELYYGILCRVLGIGRRPAMGAAFVGYIHDCENIAKSLKYKPPLDTDNYQPFKV